MGFATGPRLGMWGIERRPDLHGVAAFVSLTDAQDNNTAMQTGKFGVVPMLSYGSTPHQARLLVLCGCEQVIKRYFSITSVAGSTLWVPQCDM